MGNISRNKAVDYTQYIHEYTDSRGTTRYAVAKWDEAHCQFTCPLDKRTRELTGRDAVCAEQPSDLGGYLTRRQALRRARYLFEPDEEVSQ